MLKYLIVPLSGNSSSFCHYPIDKLATEVPFIDEQILYEIIFWSMKENLSVQFIYPEQRVPERLQELINTVEHISFVPETCVDPNILSNADIIISENLDILNKQEGKIYILRLTLRELLSRGAELVDLLTRSIRVNVVITDIKNFSRDDIEAYRVFLSHVAEHIVAEAHKGVDLQLNILTDRMRLTSMQNCNAGVENLAVSLNGNLYPCPAFFGDAQFKCGDIFNGYTAPSQKLFKFANAPICTVCDAFHCKRCVWLNRNLTHEVNTPGWQQCVMAHLEREVGREALARIRRNRPDFCPQIHIPEINYLDPLDKL